MINSIKLSALRNNEYAQFFQNFLSALYRYDPSALLVQAEYDHLLAMITGIKGLLNEDTGSDMTNELVALDTRRDDAINGVTALINGSAYSSDASLKAAANLLMAHLAAFGPAIARESYQSETSKLQKIVLDWTDKPDLKAAIATLGLDKWKTELEAANTAFDTRYVDRSVATGTADADRVYEKRPAINEAYNELREMLDAWYIVKKKTDPWATAIAAVNGVIKDYNELLAIRAGKEGGVPPDAS